MLDNQKNLIGWRERVSFPNINIGSIKAKIDTGARTSALHTSYYKIIKRNKENFVLFTLDIGIKNKKSMHTFKPVSIERKIIDFRLVRDSSGNEQSRPFIIETIAIGDINLEVELSLTNRKNMRFLMLIGRKALANNFLVDVSHSYILSKKNT